MKDRLGTCENDAEDHPQGLHEWHPFCINWHEQPAQRETMKQEELDQLLQATTILGSLSYEHPERKLLMQKVEQEISDAIQGNGLGNGEAFFILSRLLQMTVESLIKVMENELVAEEWEVNQVTMPEDLKKQITQTLQMMKKTKGKVI